MQEGANRRIKGRLAHAANNDVTCLSFDRKILAINKADCTESDQFLLPGFVDLHVHGGGGTDCMGGAEAVRQMVVFHARHGTTSLLATTVTAPIDDLLRALDGIETVRRESESGTGTPGAAVLGCHLEGPFINPAKLGAQPPHTLVPEIAVMAELVAAGPIRTVTLAPECDEGGRLMHWLQGQGIKVQAGHSLADFDTAARAIRAGAGVTHLFNAMSGMAHRAPGLAAAAMALAPHAEIIPDLLHVAPGMLLAAHRAIPGLYAVSDAVAAAGMEDGRYRLGAHEVTKCGNEVRLDDGTIAGSVLTMAQALRNLLAIGFSMAEASDMLSARPARVLGLDDRGRIEVGLRADLVVVDAGGHIREVYVGGRRVLT